MNKYFNWDVFNICELLDTFDDIGYNLKYIKEEICTTCANVGRRPEDVGILAVTKGVEAERINALEKHGITNIGESRVQDLMAKLPKLHDSFNVHFIGHLQSNKINRLLGHAKLIESVDSIQLLEDISKRSTHMQDVLLEVNVFDDVQKYGFSCDEVWRAIECVQALDNVKVKGLMTIGALGIDENETRRRFAMLRSLFEVIGAQKNVEMKILSMGMSDDYKLAILEGATEVRLGSLIFRGHDK